MNQQQINDSFQHLIDGQQKILDIQHSMPSTVTQNIIASTPSVSSRSHVPSQVAISDIELDLKHVQIQSAIVDYYGKQQFNCIASVDSAGGNTTTKSTLIKLRRLINSIHYLAKDDAHVLAWCKTIPTQRSPDWAARITLKSIELQDIVINKLKEIGCKQNNKAPYFWSTYKTFEVNKLFVQSDNYFN